MREEIKSDNSNEEEKEKKMIIKINKDDLNMYLRADYVYIYARSVNTFCDRRIRTCTETREKRILIKL